MITLDANHVYRDEGGAEIPGVTATLRAAGLIDDRFFDTYSRDRGTLVHQACALYDRDDLDETSLDPVIEPYVRAWITFRKETGFTPALVEKIIFNSVYQYAGTLDVTGTIGSHNYLIDRKSGTANPASELQTAAYAACFEQPYKRAVIELDNEGKYRLIEHKDRNDIKVFLAALAVVNWKHNQGVK